MERIKMLREQKGLSQAKLAVLADMNPATLWRYETGQRSPTVDQLERLAEVLEVEVADFFPKDQAPLPLEERRSSSIFEDAIAVTAGKWLEDMEELSGPDMSLYEKGQVSGYTDAALTLAEVMMPYRHDDESEEEAEKAYQEFIRLQPEDQQAVVRLHALLLRVAKKHAGLKEADKEENKTKELEAADG